MPDLKFILLFFITTLKIKTGAVTNLLAAKSKQLVETNGKIISSFFLTIKKILCHSFVLLKPS